MRGKFRVIGSQPTGVVENRTRRLLATMSEPINEFRAAVLRASRAGS